MHRSWLLATLIPIIFLGDHAYAQVSAQHTLHIGGWLQPRYEYSLRDGAENLSSFYLRRARLDVSGQAFRPELTYRIMPELATTASMRDAWLNYSFSPSLQVRVGQFTVPFQWHRYVGPRRQHFAERGVPSETFGFPTGRDIGVMLHGRSPDARFDYALGLFDGAGRNVVLSNSDGHMVSARATWAAAGPLPREESDLGRASDPGVSLGAGLQAAVKNEARQWDLGRSAVANRRADYLAATADLSLRWQGFSVAADAYLRHVSPDDQAVESYAGHGYMITAGLFIVPARVEVVGRFSELRLDADDPGTRNRELGGGLNIYHRGHDMKTRVQFFTGQRPEQRFARDGILLVEFHVQF